MSKRIAKIAGAALAAGAMAFMPATSSSAAPADTSYTLSVTHDETGATSSAGLLCSPPSGSHPYAGRACSQLAQADGYIEAIPDAGGVCPLIHDPVTVRATGYWNGEPRSYEETFENQCVANLETGGYVFNF